MRQWFARGANFGIWLLQGCLMIVLALLAWKLLSKFLGGAASPLNSKVLEAAKPFCVWLWWLGGIRFWAGTMLSRVQGYTIRQVVLASLALGTFITVGLHVFSAAMILSVQNHSALWHGVLLSVLILFFLFEREGIQFLFNGPLDNSSPEEPLRFNTLRIFWQTMWFSVVSLW